MLLVSITSCPLAPANSLLCLTGKRGFCIIQPPSCASSLVPSSPARGTWQLQSDWELPGFKIKAQVCETALWKQQHASDPGQHQQSLLLERNWKKMHKSHLPLLNVSYLNKIKATSDQGMTTECFIYWWQRKRKLTFWQYPWRFTVLSSCCCLLFSLLDPACANSVFCSMSSVHKILLKSWMFLACGLSSSLHLPTDDNFPDQGEKPSLPYKQSFKLEILFWHS